MRKVLFVAYHFPPIGGIGSLRAVKLAKFLPQFGWKPTILTVSKGDSFVFDDTLLNELPNAISVERAPSVEIIKTTQAKNIYDQMGPARQAYGPITWLQRRIVRLLRSVYLGLFIPDDKIGWCIPAVRKAVELSQDHRFEAIFATSPPQTDLVVASWLKRKLRVPLVLDYRDEWTTNPHKAMPNALVLQISQLWEKRILGHADMLTVVSKGMLDNLRAAQIIGNERPACHVLPNGFDPADFQIELPDPMPSTRFEIVYTGSFYGEHRVPDPFLYALHRWLVKSPTLGEKIQVSFYGSIYPRHQHLIDELQLADVVQVKGIVSHHEAVLAQKRASVLLLVIGKGEGRAIVTGKVFEYLGAQRPILAMIHPEGEAAHLVRRTRTGIVVDPDDIASIVIALERLYGEWCGGGINYDPDRDLVAQYSRVTQARQLAELLDQLSGSTPSGATIGKVVH